MPKDEHIVYRILANVVVLVIHTKLLVAAMQRTASVVHLDPQLKVVQQLGPRFLTNWNVMIQMAYTAFALVCDVSTLFKMEVPERVRSCRYYLFSSLVFPLSAAVLSFWPYYLYDESLVFHRISLEYKLVSPACNMMFHAGVFFYVLWELVFLPRDSIKKGPHGYTLGILVSVLYTGLLFYTKYGDMGVWCYEYFKPIDGTILVYVAIAFPISLSLIAYDAQWKIKDALWKYRDFVSERKEE